MVHLWEPARRGRARSGPPGLAGAGASSGALAEALRWLALPCSVCWPGLRVVPRVGACPGSAV
eukprot:11699761-Alexandrium_andersonii.AAC.1